MSEKIETPTDVLIRTLEHESIEEIVGVIVLPIYKNGSVGIKISNVTYRQGIKAMAEMIATLIADPRDQILDKNPKDT